MLIKVYGGTRSESGANLCESCRFSRIVRGRRLDEEMVLCDAIAMHTVRVEFKVTTCSDYVDANTPSYAELLEKAWILTPASRRRAAGFIRAADLEEHEHFRLLRTLDDHSKDRS